MTDETDAETILKMIEEVDPTDTANLDEIDARVWCYLKGHPFLKFWHDYSAWGPTVEYELPEAEWEIYSLTVNGYRDFKTTRWPTATFKYTRSRDALKELRPKGWVFVCQPHFAQGIGPDVDYSEPEVNYFEHVTLQSPLWLPTEELARTPRHHSGYRV